MKSYIRGSLLIVSAIFTLFSLGFIFFSEEMHQLLSKGTYDLATTSLVSAALLGMALIFLIEAQDPVRERVYGLASALGFLGIAIVLGILNNDSMQANGATLFALIVTLGFSIYLFIVQSESVEESQKVTSTGSVKKTSKKRTKTPAKKAKPAKKKTAKKKAAKKKAKKKVKKRR
jgi:peptidoglycan/LPS O-acetylase OafA/YrhL